MAIDLLPHSPEALNNRGYAYSRLDENDKAMRDLDASDGIYPAAFPLRTRGCIHLLEGRTDQATRDFDAAIELDPKYAPAYYWRAITHALQKETAGVLKNLSTATELKPEYKARAKANLIFELWYDNQEFGRIVGRE